MRFKEGSREISVRAKGMLGKEGEATRLSGVEVSFPYVAQGRTGNATITADEGLYQSEPLRATFKGNVKVRTDDGLELESDSLKYWAKEGRLFSRDDVAFRRGVASGTATGMEYRTGEGLVLQSNVKVRLEDAAGPPTDIESGTATASREQGFIEFANGVLATQGGRSLRSNRLLLNLSPDLGWVERAAAIDDVDLKSGAGEVLPGAPSGQGGERRLQCRRLNVAFRGKGVLQDALCVNGAILDVMPGAGEAPEKRRVTAPQLRFEFDDQGQLTGASGEPGAAERAARAELRRPDVRAGAAGDDTGASHPERALRDDPRPPDGGREGGHVPGRRAVHRAGAARLRPEGRLRRGRRSRHPHGRRAARERRGAGRRAARPRDPSRHAISVGVGDRQREAHDPAPGEGRLAGAARRRGADGHPVPAVRLRPAGEVGPLQGQRADALGHRRDPRPADRARRARGGEAAHERDGRRAVDDPAQAEEARARSRRRRYRRAAARCSTTRARTGSSTPATSRSGRATS